MMLISHCVRAEGGSVPLGLAALFSDVVEGRELSSTKKQATRSSAVPCPLRFELAG